MNARGRTGFASLAIALGLLLAAATATADTPLGHQGKVGSHRLRDSAGRPGVECFYESTNPNSPTESTLEGLNVRPPVVFARNATAGVDRQDVGWQFIVQRHHNTTWTEVLRTSIHFKSATDSTPAAFEKRGTNFLGNSASRYRVIVKTYWLSSTNGVVAGTARNRVDFYKGGAFTGSSFCPGGIG
jgi:hypothetical protein